MKAKFVKEKKKTHAKVKKTQAEMAGKRIISGITDKASGGLNPPEIDEERTCLLGSGAGRSPIDRVYGFSIYRKGLFNLLTLESIGFVTAEDEDVV